jgi:hypothetical protein
MSFASEMTREKVKLSALENIVMKNRAGWLQPINFLLILPAKYH